MATEMQHPPIDYSALVSGARVHGSLYRDEQVYQRELDQIWHKLRTYLGKKAAL